MLRSSIVTALLGLGSSAYAASNVNKKCQGDICYSLNIPDSSTSSQGTVYYQITGPTSYAWIGMGTGSGMAGSDIFVIYQSQSGQNVTLSPRKGSGHVMPSPDSSKQATLMDGSGVSNGQMVANIRCSNCDTSNSGFIYAANSGSLKSDSTSATISQHQNAYGTFSFDVASAKGGSDANPFTSSTSTTSGSTGSSSGSACRQNTGSSGNNGNNNAGSSGTPSSNGPPFGWFGGSRPTNFPPYPTGSSKNKRASDDDCNNSGSFNQNGSSSKMSAFNMKLMAHGIMAGLCFAVLLPFGAISIRLFSFPGLVWFHAGIQIISQIIFIIAFGMGISIADELKLMNSYHPVIGIVIFVLLLVQPVLGQMHHRAFKQVGHRTGWSYGHLWLGRIIITLGIVNGGLGFMLANNTSVGPIAYAVVAGVFYVAYLGAAVIGERRRARALPPKYSESQRGSGPTSPREFYNRPQDYELPPRSQGR